MLSLFINLYLKKIRKPYLKIIKQTTIDTTSTILGIIDGPVSLNQISGDFTLTYTENEKTVILNGDLQDEFPYPNNRKKQITMIYK